MISFEFVLDQIMKMCLTNTCTHILHCGNGSFVFVVVIVVKNDSHPFEERFAISLSPSISSHSRIQFGPN